MTQNTNELSANGPIASPYGLMGLPDEILRDVCSRISLRDFVMLSSTCKNARRLVDLFDDKTRFFLCSLLKIPFRPKEVITLPSLDCKPIDFRRFDCKFFFEPHGVREYRNSSLKLVVTLIKNGRALSEKIIAQRCLEKSIDSENLDMVDYEMNVLGDDVDYRSLISKSIDEGNFQACKFILQKCILPANEWFELYEKANQNQPFKQLLIQNPPVNDRLLHQFLTSSLKFIESIEMLKEQPDQLTDDDYKSLFMCFIVAFSIHQYDTVALIEGLFSKENFIDLLSKNECLTLLRNIENVENLSDAFTDACLFLSAKNHNLFELSIKILQSKKPPLLEWFQLFKLKKSPFEWTINGCVDRSNTLLDDLQVVLRASLPSHPFFSAMDGRRYEDAASCLSEMSVDEEGISPDFECLVIAALVTKRFDCLSILVKDPKMNIMFLRHSESPGRYYSPILSLEHVIDLIEILKQEGVRHLLRNIAEHYPNFRDYCDQDANFCTIN
jgi:hypothetical protein